jgi:agmatine deiminase
MTERGTTPRDAGFSMPPEWAPHAACLMAWPSRQELWMELLEEAKREYAEVARAIAAFEPVIMVCGPGSEREVRERCGTGVEPLPIPIDDSWMRDSGPIFVTDERGRVAAVRFRFNGWGERFTHERDSAAPPRVLAHLGIPMFEAPFVLEGGSILVDGEGTVLTTEMCLLHENRNPGMSREQIEQGLRDHLGVDTVVWLPYGMFADTGPNATDGHIDGVAQYVAPGHVLLLVPSDPADDDHDFGRANLARLEASCDAAGRSFTVSRLDPPAGARLSYANCYFANGGVIVPVAGDERDAVALARIAEVFPDREVVPVPGNAIASGGGGPHCITQQIPVGEPASL